jgi:hypothetical protein
VDLVGPISSTSFTRIATFGRRHHSPPYGIFYDYLRWLHPNGTFSQDSQVGIPKLQLLLSRNFKCSTFTLSPTCKSVFHSWTHSLRLMCPWTPHLVGFNVNVMTRLPLGFSLPSSFYTPIGGIRVLGVPLGSLSFTSFFSPRTLGWWCSTHKCPS